MSNLPHLAHSHASRFLFMPLQALRLAVKTAAVFTGELRKTSAGDTFPSNIVSPHVVQYVQPRLLSPAHRRANRMLLSHDNAIPMLCSLEHYCLL